MAKTKLTKNHRYILKNLVKGLIKETEEENKLSSERKEKIEKALKKLLDKELPKKDSEVLEKHHCLKSSCNPKIKNSKIEFEFKDAVITFTTENVLTFPTTHKALNWVGWEVPEEILELLKNHERLDKSLSQNYDRIRKNYYILIEDSKYYEDVVAVWPEAQGVQSEIICNSLELSRVNNNVIDSIKADIRRRCG
jgi:hypothetical protein